MFSHGSSGYRIARCRCAVCLAYKREESRRLYPVVYARQAARRVGPLPSDIVAAGPPAHKCGAGHYASGHRPPRMCASCREYWLWTCVGNLKKTLASLGVR